jgi:hypothetical protein
MQRLTCWIALLFSGCGAASYRSTSAGVAMAAGATAAASAPLTTQLAEQLVIEGTVNLEVAEVKDLVPALRAQVEQLGGRVVDEEVAGADVDWRARVKLRVPPQHLEEVVDWLARRGEIQEKKINSSDVSKTLFDQELAVKNAQLTLDRLEAILRQGGLSMQDVLAIEREMTRLRGEIESIKGESQFLKDRVALATLEIAMTRKSGAVHLAKAKVYPGPRVSALILLDPKGRERTRLGAGFVMHALFRAVTLELELYQAQANGSGDHRAMAVIATYGGAFYSDFLGRGERKIGNPYLGFRAGYAYVDSHRFATQAEAGLELWKSQRFVIDASARFTGLIGSSVDAAVVLGASAALAF